MCVCYANDLLEVLLCVHLGVCMGTPVRPFPRDSGSPTGVPFEMVAIGVHHVRDGQAVATWHVEDWRDASSRTVEYCFNIKHSQITYCF